MHEIEWWLRAERSYPRYSPFHDTFSPWKCLDLRRFPEGADVLIYHSG